MSLPPLIRENYREQAEYNRVNRDAVNGLIKALRQTGTTAQRPVGASPGWQYYDSTLGKPCWWNGTVWKDAAGTTV